MIKVQSAGFHAGDFSKIEINDQILTPKPSIRGLNLIILNKDGKLKKNKVFDTYKSSLLLD